MAAKLHSLAHARARRAVRTHTPALAATLADLLESVEAEERLPQSRLTTAALAKLKNDMVPLAGSGARVVIANEELYAMARELLDSRAELDMVRASRGDFEAGESRELTTTTRSRALLSWQRWTGRGRRSGARW